MTQIGLDYADRIYPQIAQILFLMPEAIGEVPEALCGGSTRQGIQPGGRIHSHNICVNRRNLRMIQPPLKGGSRTCRFRA